MFSTQLTGLLLLSTLFVSPLASGQQTSTEISLPSEHTWTSLSVVNEQTWWVGSADGYIWTTENNGDSFEKSKPTGETNPLYIRQIHAIDDRRAFMLTSGEGGNSRLYTTRNQGFSWQRLYRGKGDEHLRCFAVIPDGEGWIFADTLYDNWHVIRSSNGRNWLDSRNGFAGPVQTGERFSNRSDQCARFENNVWVAGTFHAATPRLIYKDRNALRFEVVDTPLTGGSEAGIHAVWPLSETHILIAGGTSDEPELYRYENESFTRVPTPNTNRALLILFYVNERLYTGNEEGLWFTNNWGETWESATIDGIKAFDCGRDNACYALTMEGNVVRM